MGTQLEEAKSQREAVSATFVKPGSSGKGRGIARGLPGRRSPALAGEQSYEGPGEAFLGYTPKEVPGYLTMSHVFTGCVCSADTLL